MGFSIKGLLYRVFIDPLINGLRRRVVSMIVPGEKVIDIACGTGALSVAMSRHAGHVTGIDFSQGMITTARRTAQRRRVENVSFELLDATDLSCYPDLSFDVAVSTLAMHQFEPETAVKVLEEMRRLAKRIIIADYSCPMTPGPAAWLAWGIERAAWGDHYSNFRKYMARGGLGRLAAEAGLVITSSVNRGEGVFTITRMSLR
ncbi:MAG: class I SAM-dependent methyltransferase [Bacteroidales bacterium]|nr:class I SAM-dependent methyltransferase [Bacteroidales bacterium]MDT8372371.1 class I SAM-dependent methyltransferase [Bacteroidales bacterium]